MNIVALTEFFSKDCQEPSEACVQKYHELVSNIPADLINNGIYVEKFFEESTGAKIEVTYYYSENESYISNLYTQLYKYSKMVTTETIQKSICSKL